MFPAQLEELLIYPEGSGTMRFALGNPVNERNRDITSTYLYRGAN